MGIQFLLDDIGWAVKEENRKYGYGGHGYIDRDGNHYVKKGLLLCGTSTSTDNLAKKLHALLVGDPGLAKTQRVGF